MISYHSSDTNQPTVAVVTGANRGIGFELVTQLAAADVTVVAGYRTESSASDLFRQAEECDRVLPVKLDVTEESQVKHVGNVIHKKFGYLDVLFNNAGMNIKPKTPFHGYEPEDFARSLAVNVIGPYVVTKTLHPLLRKGTGKTIVNLTSKMGSIALSSGGAEPYRVSKAGLNMLTKSQAMEYQNDRMIVVCIHPGWVATDMGGRNAALTTAQSVAAMLKLISGLTHKDTGRYLAYDGTDIPY